MISEKFAGVFCKRPYPPVRTTQRLFAENTVNHSIRMIADKVDAIQDAVVAGAAVRVYKGLRASWPPLWIPANPVSSAVPSRPPGLGQGKAAIDIVLQASL